ncbi:hypothetical protein QUF56_01270 [Ureibacillus composti]|nr:hypothetical protein [Ureibacillus composti]
MMVTNNEVDYRNTRKDLQDINGRLFYSELKVNMKSHLQQLEDEYKKVEESMLDVQAKLKRFEDDINQITKETAGQMRITLDSFQSDAQQQIPNLSQQIEDVAWNTFKSFRNLAVEQKHLIAQTSEEWLNLSAKLIESQKKTYDMIVGDLQIGEIEQQGGLQESLNAIKEEHEQQKEKMNGMFNSLVEEVRQKQQDVISALNDLNADFIETNKTYELQTAAEIETRDMLWQKQKEDLHLVQQTLGNQMILNKKWMIAVGTTQVIMAAAIAGLYFF